MYRGQRWEREAASEAEREVEGEARQEAQQREESELAEMVQQEEQVARELAVLREEHEEQRPADEEAERWPLYPNDAGGHPKRWNPGGVGGSNNGSITTE